MLILGEWLVSAAAEHPKRAWGVRVVGDRIREIGPHDDLRSAHPDDEVIDATDHIVMPGFVNTHMHMYGTLAHGIPIDQAPSGFWGFLRDFWWPRVEDVLDLTMISAATDWVCAEMLQSGTTTFFDILEAPSVLPGALAVEREIVEQRGLRGVLSFEATERVSEDNGQAGLGENLALIESSKDSELVSGAMCFHTTFTCSPTFITQAFELAAEHDVVCHAHCNEGIHEGLWCEEQYGRRTLEFYDALGVAGPRFLASQVVQLSDRERQIIADREIRCSHMPLSNAEVGGGIAPIPELLEGGVTIGLGSDGYVNDMFEVMRSAFLIHKARRMEPGTMPASTVLEMATEAGARALDIDRLGRLERGWLADLQIVDGVFPTPATEANLVDQLVLWRNQSHVRDVMVNGVWRVRGGAVLGADPVAMRARVHEQAERLWAS